MKKILSISLAVLLVLGVLGYFGAGYAVYEQLSVPVPDQGDAANNPVSYVVTYPEYAWFDATAYRMPRYEEVSFPSRQPDIRLAGWYIEVDPAAPVVVITHGVGASRRAPDVLVPAGMLTRAGFNVLLYDMRNHGDSDVDNGRVAIGNKEYRDVLGAWDWLVNTKGYAPQRIGLYGVSLGGGTTLMAFGQEPRAAAAFVDSPFANLREIIRAELVRNGYPAFLAESAILTARLIGGQDLLAHSPTEAITADAGRPLYLVHGTGDTRISVAQTRELEALARQEGANVTVWLPEDVEHVAAVFVLPDEYEQRLVSFFRAALK